MSHNNSRPIVLRLVTGDHVFGVGELVGEHYVVDDPLALEEQESEDAESTTYVFLNRLERYSDAHTVSIHHDKVLFVSPMSPAVKEYYDRSLRLVRDVMDDKFATGLADAVRYMDSAIKMRDEATSSPDLREQVFTPSDESPERLAVIRDRLTLSQLATSSKKTH